MVFTIKCLKKEYRVVKSQNIWKFRENFRKVSDRFLVPTETTLIIFDSVSEKIFLNSFPFQKNSEKFQTDRFPESFRNVFTHTQQLSPSRVHCRLRRTVGSSPRLRDRALHAAHIHHGDV